MAAPATDPWALLTVGVATDSRRVGATHFDWAPRLTDEPALAGSNALDCIDMMYPYDYANSFGYNLGSNGVDFCASHGFVYEYSTEVVARHRCSAVDRQRGDA